MRPIIRRGLVGSVVGACFGLAGIVGGVLVAGAAASRGRKVTGWEELTGGFVASYLVPFAAAGALLGLLWPWTARPRLRFLVFWAAGVLFMAAVLRDFVRERWMDWPGVVFVLLALGAIVGLFGVYLHEREYGPPPPIRPSARRPQRPKK